MSETEMLAEILELVRVIAIIGAIQCGLIVGCFIAVNLNRT